DGPSGERRVRIQELCDQFCALEREILAISDPLYSRLQMLGLATSARTFCESRCAEHGLNLDFQGATVSTRVPDPVALAIFRVLQESLDNVIAHARASHVTVALGESPAEIDL